jgi:hypothetical protein
LKKILPSELFFNSSNPSGPYLTPDYPISCIKWTQKDKFELEVKMHVYMTGNAISKIELVHQPTGISISRDLKNEEVETLEQELMTRLQERVEKTR